MLCTFKGRKALWTKRNKAEFGDFIQVSGRGKLQVNFGLFIKTKDRLAVVSFHDLFPIKDGFEIGSGEGKTPYVPLFHVKPDPNNSEVRINPDFYYIPVSLNYWGGPSRNLQTAVKVLQGFIEGLGEIDCKKLGEILTGVEKAYAA